MDDKITKKTKEILGIIQDEKRVTYTELKKIVNISDTALSKYLKVLKNENLVNYAPYGKQRLYSINEEEIETRSDLLVGKNINKYLSNIEKTSDFSSDDVNKTLGNMEKMITAVFFYLMDESTDNAKSLYKELDVSRIIRILLKFYFDFIFRDKNESNHYLSKSEYKDLLSKSNFDKIFFHLMDGNLTTKQLENSVILSDFISKRYSKYFKSLYH